MDNKKGTSYVGGIVGKAVGVTMTNCRVEGTIINHGKSPVSGGLAASMEGGLIENSTANVRIIHSGDEIFSELRIALEQIEKVDERQKLIRLVDDMESSVGESTFKEKYASFMSGVADHMTVMAPFLTKLLEFI